ncbi:hypothetical protein AL755_18170 [Arthrobacter sp. ERGS1:01]|nr:hypothetical protein AL755_18170 [Arthrobacter sp. ERGS1:01]
MGRLLPGFPVGFSPLFLGLLLLGGLAQGHIEECSGQPFQVGRILANAAHPQPSFGLGASSS